MNVRALFRTLAALFLVPAVFTPNAPGQLPYQEGFNDDGDGMRYTLGGRGFELVGDDEVPSMWEHDFNSPQIGLVADAPARRAAIMWTHDYPFALGSFGDFESESFDVWTNLANWALDGQQNATIGFLPSYGENNAMFESVAALAELFQGQGHTVTSIPNLASIPDPAGPDAVDLVIHTGELAADTALAAYPVPVITFNVGNFDDVLIAKQTDTTFTIDGPLTLEVVAENADHPVLDGIPNPVPWTGNFTSMLSLPGIGAPGPGGEVLLTFTDPATGDEYPALVVIDEGGGLLGSFKPQPEGAGYIVGASLEDFNTDVIPKTLELNPVDISGATEDVELTVALAATDADFEPSDYLRVLAGQSGDFPENFVLLDEFLGVDDPGGPFNKAMSRDGGMTGLSSSEFTDYTWNITELAPDITELVVRFEAFNTFGNEIYGIDNVRITAGDVPPPMGIPGDYNNNGQVEQGDLDLVLLNWGANLSADWVTDVVDQEELDGVLLNWGNTATLGAAAGVPEPSTLGIALLGLLAAVMIRRRPW